MVLPYPYKIYDDVTQIILPDLQSMGVKGVLLDIDGTLMRTKDKAPEDRVFEWINTLKQNGILVYVLSNNKHPERVKALAESIGAEWTYLAHKPKKAGFCNAAKSLGLEHCEIAVVGDQIFTDMFGAARCGMKGLIVSSLDTYLWYYYPRHLLEIIFWREKRK